MNYYNENDPKAAAWLRELIKAELIPAGDVDERSIVDVKPHELTRYIQCHFFAGIGGWSYALRLAGWPASDPVWTGSCPCQPLSGAGQRKGHADERHLWPAFYALIAERKPAIVFGEQVASADGREWLAGVRADLEGIGHAVGAANLCAAGVGAKQKRQRLYWTANAAAHNGRSRHLLEACRIRESQAQLGGLSSIKLDGKWWSSHIRRKRSPVIVRPFNGLSEILAGLGNAIVPQLAAEFIKASVEAITL